MPKINEKAEQELAEVQAMFDAGEHRKARAEFAEAGFTLRDAVPGDARRPTGCLLFRPGDDP